MTAANSPKTAPGRPFKPGQSGNPSGRPKGIVALAKEKAGRAFDYLAEVIDDTAAPHAARITAAREVLDRAYGKPLAMTADVTDRLDDLDDDAIDAALAAIRDALRAGSETGGGKGPQTAH